MTHEISIQGDLTWDAIEALALSHYISLGYSVLIPIIKTTSYDMGIEKDGIVKLVNVKVAGLKDKRQENSWSISLSSAGSDTIYGRKTPNESYVKDLIKKKTYIDLYLVWLPHKNKFVELTGDFFATSGSKSRRIPREMLDIT